MQFTPYTYKLLRPLIIGTNFDGAVTTKRRQQHERMQTNIHVLECSSWITIQNVPFPGMNSNPASYIMTYGKDNERQSSYN